MYEYIGDKPGEIRAKPASYADWVPADIEADGSYAAGGSGLDFTTKKPKAAKGIIIALTFGGIFWFCLAYLIFWLFR
jgi:hypothetical protein